MDDKQAAEILIAMLKEYDFAPKEKEAMAAAIGILSWTSLAKSNIKNKKAKRDKSYKW
jgi:hypothetical protein